MSSPPSYHTLPVRYPAGIAGPTLTKTSERLFPGISTSSNSSSPWSAAPRRGRLRRERPSAVPPLQICVEGGIGRSRDPSGLKRRPAPARSPSAASQGAMWTIFKKIIASNGASSSTPHTSSRTSMATGARTLASPSVTLHALMLAREAEPGLLGSASPTRLRTSTGFRHIECLYNTNARLADLVRSSSPTKRCEAVIRIGLRAYSHRRYFPFCMKALALISRC
jgi:hypothetical protein